LKKQSENSVVHYLSTKHPLDLKGKLMDSLEKSKHVMWVVVIAVGQQNVFEVAFAEIGKVVVLEGFAASAGVQLYAAGPQVEGVEVAAAAESEAVVVEGQNTLLEGR
jgi:hypothetical protein